MQKTAIKEPPKNGHKTEEVLRRELSDAKRAKARECADKISQILEQYGFVLSGRPYIENGAIQAEAILVPKVEE